MCFTRSLSAALLVVEAANAASIQSMVFAPMVAEDMAAECVALSFCVVVLIVVFAFAP